GVVPVAGDEDVVSVTADERVVAADPGQSVVARPAVEGVVRITADERVVADAAGERGRDRAGGEGDDPVVAVIANAEDAGDRRSGNQFRGLPGGQVLDQDPDREDWVAIVEDRQDAGRLADDHPVVPGAAGQYEHAGRVQGRCKGRDRLADDHFLV